MSLGEVISEDPCEGPLDHDGYNCVPDDNGIVGVIVQIGIEGSHEHNDYPVFC